MLEIRGILEQERPRPFPQRVPSGRGRSTWGPLDLGFGEEGEEKGFWGWGTEHPGCVPCMQACTETRRVEGQPSSSTGPWSGSSREYSTQKVTGFT